MYGEQDPFLSVAGQAAKQGAKRLAKQAAKTGARIAIKGLAALAGAVGWPLVIILILLFLLFLLMAAFYGAMPGQASLIGVNPSPQDQTVRVYAEQTASSWNKKETWLVSGEGAWYPQQGSVNLGRMVDRYGQDAKLMNQWGDIYAPVLYQAAEEGQKDVMQDQGWVEERLDDAAENLKPWFYYKESYVEYTSVDSQGESNINRQPVYLLVEAYTIRGHYLYRYNWATKTYSDDSSVTFEEPAGSERISDGLGYIKKYLLKAYHVPDDEQAEVVVMATLEMGKGFSAGQENMAWLQGYGSLSSFVSGASIPAEYRGYLEEASKLTGVPVWLLAAIIERESSWDPGAVNDQTGCFGLTQLNPLYWPEWARQYGFDTVKDRGDPRVQIIVGAKVLASFAGVDWSNLDPSNPPAPVLAGLARYGGYGADVVAAQGYIQNIMLLAAAYNAHPGVWPVPGYYAVTSPFGMRYHPVLKVWKGHEGMDIGAPEGAAVVSVSAGVVAQAGRNAMGEAYGNAILIRDVQYEYLYSHLSRVGVSARDKITPGMEIGLVGSTGLTTGSHLHFGVRPVGSDEWIDPEPLLQIQGR